MTGRRRPRRLDNAPRARARGSWRRGCGLVVGDPQRGRADRVDERDGETGSSDGGGEPVERATEEARRGLAELAHDPEGAARPQDAGGLGERLLRVLDHGEDAAHDHNIERGRRERQLVLAPRRVPASLVTDRYRSHPPRPACAIDPGRSPRRRPGRDRSAESRRARTFERAGARRDGCEQPSRRPGTADGTWRRSSRSCRARSFRPKVAACEFPVDPPRRPTDQARRDAYEARADHRAPIGPL
jgi:hypothetical protein